ncbi:hypothetical protein V8F20_007609 [Naviculisporaceae sp. PSN 640]
MSFKRSRAAYEADLTAQQSPYVLFGTPLPPLDPEVRDDGSYVPVWKQEVRDERGRKRLHGAFTGGFSAGYFNTVGSKEGWTPSTFVSSRTNRRKDDPGATQQRPEDFMDEEDLAEAEESRRLQTNAAFSGLGSTETDAARLGGIIGLFRPEGETMGTKLLRKMGWKDGQGVGPKVRRKAQLGLQRDSQDGNQTHLFAPENVPMIAFIRKTDSKGLGFGGLSKLIPLGQIKPSNTDQSDEEDDDDVSFSRPKFSLAAGRKKTKEKSRGGIGIGILNDTGSDDEDPYEIGPKISYNRVIGGDKKKKKKATAMINPAVKTKPVFISTKSSALNKVALGVRKCHDGRLPLDGFVFGKEADKLISEVNSEGKYPPPKIPPDWVSSKKPKSQSDPSTYLSTADAAKASKLDPKARAALLGETQLPGKSVFDFMSAAARERLAAVTGRTDLPPARGEIPAGYAMSEEDRQRDLLERIPRLDKETAIAALSRGTGAGAPYADNEVKRARYRAYLEYQAGFKPSLPPKPAKMTTDEWLQEAGEFFNCARIFKPMSGFMASRFTTSSSAAGSSIGQGADKELLTKPPPKPLDPAEEAAKMGMFGPMTRSRADFYPTKLLCKRFNVKAVHVAPDNYEASASKARSTTSSAYGSYDNSRRDFPLSGYGAMSDALSGNGRQSNPVALIAEVPKPAEKIVVDPSINEALEGPRADESLFKDIFAGKLPRELAEKDLEAYRFNLEVGTEIDKLRSPAEASASGQRSPPPQYPASEASSSSSTFRSPPPFSSLFATLDPDTAASVLEPSVEPYKHSVADEEADEGPSSSTAAPAYSDPPLTEPSTSASRFQDETKRALPQDTKGESSRSNKEEDSEPPPAYSEGSSPLLSFTYLMAAAGGASSIITQVQQGGPPINTLGDVAADETITMDLRGTRFSLSRDELLTLPEFVLLSLFPNGLFPEGQMGGGFSDNDAVQVDYDPASLQYMLDFFRNVAQSIPADASGSSGASAENDVVPLDPGARDDSSKRAGIIVLREDLDFYAIPHKKGIDQAEMMEVKRAAAKALLKQDGIFSGLKRSDEPGTTEAHLIEMLTAGGFNHDDTWGHRAGEPNKAVICSLALARLRSDIRGNEMGNNAVGMAQKLLLFWRKPARRCWWEGVELDNVEGVEGKLKVWIRRVWTLEMSVIGLR